MNGDIAAATKGKNRDVICTRLLEYDPEIVEIVQFGSSVYAPQYARDLDLLVITKEKKGYGGYLDSLDVFLFDVDVVVKEVDEILKSDFAFHVLGAFEVLYGDGRYLREITKYFDPSFEDAWICITGIEGAENVFKRSTRARSEDERNGSIRLAFNRLFDAARIAAMAYMATEDARWGRTKRRLPQPYRNEFEEFINVLHIEYFYNGNYPDNYEEEFEKWHHRVEDFVRKLERMAK